MPLDIDTGGEYVRPASSAIWLRELQRMHMVKSGLPKASAQAEYCTSNDGGVAGIVLGDVLLDLADQVSAHVSSLGVDATAHASEQRNGGASQPVSGNGLKDALPVIAIHLQASQRCQAQVLPTCSLQACRMSLKDTLPVIATHLEAFKCCRA